TNWLVENRSAGQPGQQFQVWVTSLCSYWFGTVAEICRRAKEVLADAKVVVLGEYARLMPEHVADSCAADFVLSKPVDLDNQPASLDLYREAPPPFHALRLSPEAAVTEVRNALKRGLFHFAFFEENILRDGGGPFCE